MYRPFDINAQRGNSRIPGAPWSIRPAILGGGNQPVKISEITYIDENDPSTNFYGANAQMAINDDITIRRYAVVKLPRPVTVANSPAMIVMDSVAAIRATTWDYTNTPTSIRLEANIIPITGWNGRTISDLTWNNYADLSLGSIMASNLIVAAVGTAGDTSALGIYLGELEGGAEVYANTDVRIGAFILNQNMSQTVEGFVFIPGIFYTNLFRGATPANGNLNLTKPTAVDSPTIDAFFYAR